MMASIKAFWSRRLPPLWVCLLLVVALLLLVGSIDFADGGSVGVALLGIAGAVSSVLAIVVLSFF